MAVQGFLNSTWVGGVSWGISNFWLGAEVTYLGSEGWVMFAFPGNAGPLQSRLPSTEIRTELPSRVFFSKSVILGENANSRFINRESVGSS